MKLRFTNRAVKALFDEHGIDLMSLGGDVMMNADARLKITRAGYVGPKKPEEIPAICDDLTPGDHIDILQEAILRDLLPSSAREARAKAAETPKSEPAPA